MLKKKLKRQAPLCSNNDAQNLSVHKMDKKSAEESNGLPLPKNLTSKYFSSPLWKTFYEIECELNKVLQDLKSPSSITYTYNPLIYAGEVHCAYLQKFLTGPKRLMFVGMNPGPNGMGQNGVPFNSSANVSYLMFDHFRFHSEIQAQYGI